MGKTIKKKKKKKKQTKIHTSQHGIIIVPWSHRGS